MVQVPQLVPELEEAEEKVSRRTPRLIVAAGGALWVTMASAGVAILHPQLSMVCRMAMRVATGGHVISPQDFALAPPASSRSSSASAGSAAPAGWWCYTDPSG